jgi:hypothetical protein
LLRACEYRHAPDTGAFSTYRKKMNKELIAAEAPEVVEFAEEISVEEIARREENFVICSTDF